MSTENTHRDIRAKLNDALDLISDRLRALPEGTLECGQLCAARSSISRAYAHLEDAESTARVEVAREVQP